MFDLSVSDFLKSSSTHLTSAYGHLVREFELQHDLASTSLVHFGFNNSAEQKKLDFRYDISNNEIHDFSFTDKDGVTLGQLKEEDRELIKKVLPVYFARIGTLTRKITKNMRHDWGREFKTEALERKGFCYYMSQECNNIENNYRLSMVRHTLATLNKKRVYPFEFRN